MKLSAIALLAAGVAIGICVGIVGTGGAFIIPALVYLFGMGQLKAQGTALLIAAFPVWFFAFIPYWRAGHFDLKAAVLLGAGIALGGYFGGIWAQHLSEIHVRKVFAIVLFGVAVKMFFE